MTRTEFAKSTGTPDRKILFYTENGLFPDINRYVGRGAARQYTKTEIIDLAIIKELKKFDIPLNKIKEIIDYIHSSPDAKPFTFVWCPDDGFRIEKESKSKSELKIKIG